MARTKSTKQEFEVDAGVITVVNNTSYMFRVNLYIKIPDYVMAEWMEHHPCGRYQGQPLIVPGTNSIPLLKRSQCEQAVWTLISDQYGVLPSQHQYQIEDRSWKIEVVPSGTYHLDIDPNNLMLTEGQYNILERLLLNVLQQSSPYAQMWSNIRAQILDKFQFEFGHIPEKLDDAFLRYARDRRVKLPNWQNQYPMLQLKANPNKIWVTQSCIDRELNIGGCAQIDVYWRALDRQPGGNTDVHTVCYTFDCAAQTVSTRWARNWDGHLERCEYKPQHLSDKIQAEELVNGPFHSFLEALKRLGPGDSECTVLDEISTDASECDTTWTSHEILVTLPKRWNPSVHQSLFPIEYHRSAKQVLLVNQRLMRFPIGVMQNILKYAAPRIYVPVIRFHQRCLLGPQWRMNERLEQGPEIPPTPIQENVLNATKDLIGMGRVNTWSNAGDGQPPCEACRDRPIRSEWAKYEKCPSYMQCVFHPYYFSFLACNVAGAQVGDCK